MLVYAVTGADDCTCTMGEPMRVIWAHPVYTDAAPPITVDVPPRIEQQARAEQYFRSLPCRPWPAHMACPALPMRPRRAPRVLRRPGAGPRRWRSRVIGRRRARA